MLVLCDGYEQNTWESTEETANISGKETFELKLEEYIEIFQIDRGGSNIVNRRNVWMQRSVKEHSMFGIEKDILKSEIVAEKEPRWVKLGWDCDGLWVAYWSIIL